MRGGTPSSFAGDEVLLPGVVDNHVHVNEARPHGVGGLTAEDDAKAQAQNLLGEVPELTVHLLLGRRGPGGGAERP